MCNVAPLAQSGRGGSPQERLVDACNRELSKALTSQTLATEIQGEGSRAASETHRERETSVAESDREMVSRTLGELFAWTTELNFGAGVAPPRHEFAGEAGVRTEWAELYGQVRSFLPVGRAEVYDRLGISPPRDGEELLPGGPPPAGAASMSAPACPGCGAPAFAAAVPDDPVDRALRALDLAAETGAEAGRAAEALAAPVLAAARDDPGLLLGRLAELHPRLDGDALEDLLARVIFLAEVWGRLHGDGPA